MTICWDVALVVAGCVISGAITFYIVWINRKTIERNNLINIKNELLRDLERRALYVWSGGKKNTDFNIDLEHSHLLADIKRIEDKYKDLKKGCGKNSIPSELIDLSSIVVADDIENIVASPSIFTSEELTARKDKIRDLTAMLESIPPK